MSGPRHKQMARLRLTQGRRVHTWEATYGGKAIDPKRDRYKTREQAAKAVAAAGFKGYVCEGERVVFDRSKEGA